MIRRLISNSREDGFISGQFEGAFHRDGKGGEAVVLSYEFWAMGMRAWGSRLGKLGSRNHTRYRAEMQTSNPPHSQLPSSSKMALQSEDYKTQNNISSWAHSTQWEMPGSRKGKGLVTLSLKSEGRKTQILVSTWLFLSSHSGTIGQRMNGTTHI